MTRAHSPATLAATLATALVTTLACGDPDARGATQVKMLDNVYNAPVVRIPEGAGVAFINHGRNPHNIVPVDPLRWPAVDTSAVAPGGKLALTLEKAGVYEFYCSYHGTKDGRGMAGAVVVGDAEYTGGVQGKLAAVPTASGIARRVPAEYPTIQAAVDAAGPGDFILIAAGIYKEEVTVTTPSLIIRGMDRNETIIDGEFIRPNGFNVLADGVAIENLTARHATLNGFFWTGVTGFRGRFLTAYNNGDYGIYAFDSRDGLIEDSYASGSPDAGFYIGQCHPCDVVIRRVLAEHNAVGYSGTNAGGNLFIVNSVWRHNRGGLVPNTLDTELYPPQRGTTIKDNLIYSNNSRTAPGRGLSPLAWGNGIVLGGGRQNLVEKNVIVDHAGHGVMIAPLADANFWPAKDNIVRQNWFARNSRADVSVGGPASSGNLVINQESVTRTSPVSVGSGGLRLTHGAQNDLTPTIALAMRIWRLRGLEYPDWKTQPIPPPQRSMSFPEMMPIPPAVNVFAAVRNDFDEGVRPFESEDVFRWAKEKPHGGIAPFLARTQALMPLTPRGLAFVAALLLIQILLMARARLAGRDGYGHRMTARVIGAIAAAWIGLALAVASIYSGI